MEEPPEHGAVTRRRRQSQPAAQASRADNANDATATSGGTCRKPVATTAVTAATACWRVGVVLLVLFVLFGVLLRQFDALLALRSRPSPRRGSDITRSAMWKPSMPSEYRAVPETTAWRVLEQRGTFSPASMESSLRYDFVAAAPFCGKSGNASRRQGPQRLCVEFGLDDGGRRFLSHTLTRQRGVLSSAAYKLLRLFLSHDASSALVQAARGSFPDLFLLSRSQWQTLLFNNHPVTHPPNVTPSRSALDIGTGTGDLARELMPLFGKLVTTEVSSVMTALLRFRGHTAVTTATLDHPDLQGQKFDVVFLNNVRQRMHGKALKDNQWFIRSSGVRYCQWPQVTTRGSDDAVHVCGASLDSAFFPLFCCGPKVLDVAQQPLNLLAQARSFLADAGGRLVVAIPLPYGKRGALQEYLSQPDDWLSSVSAAMAMFDTYNLTTKHVSRAPYLCQGSSKTPFPVYVLDAAVFVLEAN
eukprot:m.300242 g.300242  ORF g.300242 m.300242 type:complete len:472 (+) comp19554_c0_seq7:763-2178(+)